MSETSKAARAAMKKKAHRLANGSEGERVDASDYKVPGEMDTERKTGPKPLNPRMFKRGGKVEGAEATHHAGKKPRAKRDLGGPMSAPPAAAGGAGAGSAAGSGAAGPMMNLPAAAQAQIANATRTPNPLGMLGSRPVQSWMARAGGIKKGGRVKKASGGEAHSDEKEDRALIDKMVKPSARKAKGGEVVGNTEVTGTRPTGGRLARKDGGRSGKGKMNVNIIIAQKPDSAMGAGGPPMPPGMPPHPIPPPMMPPGAMGGMPSGMPPMGGGAPPMGAGVPPGMPPALPRAAGGRLFPKMEAGAGGGEGRLEKLKEYGDKFAKEGNKGD